MATKKNRKWRKIQRTARERQRQASHRNLRAQGRRAPQQPARGAGDAGHRPGRGVEEKDLRLRPAPRPAARPRAHRPAHHPRGSEEAQWQRLGAGLAVRRRAQRIPAQGDRLLPAQARLEQPPDRRRLAPCEEPAFGKTAGGPPRPGLPPARCASRASACARPSCAPSGRTRAGCRQRSGGCSRERPPKPK